MDMTRNTNFFLNLEKSCAHNNSNKYFEDKTALTEQKEKNKNSFSIKRIFFIKQEYFQRPNLSAIKKRN